MEAMFYGVGTIAGRAANVAVRFAQQSARQHRPKKRRRKKK